MISYALITRLGLRITQAYLTKVQFRQSLLHLILKLKIGKVVVFLFLFVCYHMGIGKKNNSITSFSIHFKNKGMRMYSSFFHEGSFWNVFFVPKWGGNLTLGGLYSEKRKLSKASLTTDQTSELLTVSPINQCIQLTD